MKINNEKIFLSIISPGFVFFIMNTLMLIIYHIIPSEILEALGKTKKINDMKLYIVYFLYIIIFSILCSFFSKSKNLDKQKKIDYLKKKSNKILKVFKILSIILFILQIVWITRSILKYSDFIKYIFNMDSLKIKGFLYLTKIKGVTTFLLLSNICVILLSLLKNLLNQKISRKYYFLVAFPIVFRGIYGSERIIIMEAIICYILIYLYSKLIIKEIKIKKIFILFIILGIFFVLLFVYAESKRSYLTYKYVFPNYGAFEWGIYRLLLYFATSANYGLNLLKANLPATFPFYTIGSFSQFIFQTENRSNPELVKFIKEIGDLEYNTPTFIGVLYLEYKYFLIISLFILAIIISYFFNKFKNLDIQGLVMYPLFLLGILDSVRTFSMTSTKIMLPLIFVYMFSIVLRKIKI